VLEGAWLTSEEKRSSDLNRPAKREIWISDAMEYLARESVSSSGDA